jgi:hypothetical protein
VSIRFCPTCKVWKDATAADCEVCGDTLQRSEMQQCPVCGGFRRPAHQPVCWDCATSDKRIRQAIARGIIGRAVTK